MSAQNGPADFRFTLYPSTQAKIYDAESELIRIDEHYFRSKVFRSLRIPLMSIEAICAAQCQLNCEIPILPLMQGFCHSESSKSRDLKTSIYNSFGHAQTEKTYRAAFAALAYMKAIDWVSRNVHPETEITPDMIRHVHELCCSGYVFNNKTEGFRTQPPNNAEECGRTPSPAEVPFAIDALCLFLNSKEYSAIGQSSVFHFEFARIVPFDRLDETTGLALSYAVFFKRGLFKSNLIVPFSWGGSINYEYRQKLIRPYLSATAHRSFDLEREQNEWSLFNTRNSALSAQIARLFLDRAQDLNRSWRSKGFRIPARSALDGLLDLFLGFPRLSVKQASDLLGKSFGAVNDALCNLEKRGIVEAVPINNKERMFVSPESEELISSFMQKLDSLRNAQSAK